MPPASLQLHWNCVFAPPILATGLSSDLCPISKHKPRQQQERPLHSQADKALVYPGIWISKAAPETPGQEQAASTLLESRILESCTLSTATPAPSALLGTAVPALTACSQANQKESILGSKKKRWKKACYHNAAPPSRLNVYRASGNLSESLPKSWCSRHKLLSR